MARILIGNVKGPIGATGPDGPRGPEGPQGIQGPLCPLTNNALATVPGVAALDAVMGKTLSDKDTALQTAVTQLNSDLIGASEILTGGDSIVKLVKKSNILYINIEKTPRIPPKGNVTIGATSFISAAAIKVPVGDAFNYFDCFIIIENCVVKLYNNSPSEIALGYYKGSAIIII